MTLLARRTFTLGAFVLALAPRGRSFARAAESGPSDYDVKAAFLYNFAKFIEWPPWTFDRAGGAMVVAVVGDDPFGASLARIAREERVQGRPIVLRRVTRPEDLGACHIVFIAPRERGGSPDLLITRTNAPYRLVVGDEAGFAERGGGIGFFLDQRRVKFTVNLAATERAGLKVSSKLLKLARIVRN